MRWLIVLLLLASCERGGQPALWRAPKVGDRASGRFQFAATVADPDGRSHTLASVHEFTSETMAIDGELPTVIRMVIDRNERVHDGVSKPEFTGTFELTLKTDGILEATRVGGTITEEERAFFANPKRRPSHATAAATKRFLRQRFEAGQTYALTPEAIMGLGLGMSSVELTVTEVTAANVVFQIKSTGELTDLGATLKATGTLRLFERGRELVQDGELFRGGKPIGTTHVELRSKTL